LNNFSPFRILEQLALVVKISFPWIHCIAYILLIILDFWTTCACPEIFRCIWNIFYTSRFLSNLRLPSK